MLAVVSLTKPLSQSVVVQYIMALKRLAERDDSYEPQRTIIFTAVPDEEIGGRGMANFLASRYYEDVVIGRMGGIALALDEGLASETETYSVFYGERLPWWVEVEAKGNTGHGSRFIEPTAIEQIIRVTNNALEFRKEQKDLLFGSYTHYGCAHAVAAKKKKTLGDVTSLNITYMHSGVDNGNGTFAKNVVPPGAKVTFDIRISPHQNPSDIMAKLNGWCRACSKEEGGVGGVTWKFIGEGNDYKEHAKTSTDPKVNPMFKHFVEGVALSGIAVEPAVFPAATDSRFLRALGIRALGFSPMRHSEILLHDYNEHVDVAVFEEGLNVYYKLIEHLSSSKTVD